MSGFYVISNIQLWICKITFKYQMKMNSIWKYMYLKDCTILKVHNLKIPFA